jgi:hypothetical protein
LQVKELGLALRGIVKDGVGREAERKRSGRGMAVARKRLAGNWAAPVADGGKSGLTAHRKQPFWEDVKRETPPAVTGRDGIAAGPLQHPGSYRMTFVARAKNNLKAEKPLPSW